MNPAIFAATTAANSAVTAALAATVAQRLRLLQRLQELPPREATRERVLEGQPELAPVLEHMLQQRMLRLRPDGTLRHDPEPNRAAARSAGKVALLVACVVVLLVATVVAMLLASAR